MAKYEGEVLESFTDLEDSNRVYYAGDTYPHPDAKGVTAARFKALSSEDNKRGKRLVKSFTVDAADHDETETPVAPENYEGMTVAQLKDIAKDKGHKGFSHLKRSELIELISK